MSANGDIASRAFARFGGALSWTCTSILAAVLLLALVGPALSPWDYDAIDWDRMNEGPSAAHWFGTDTAGRDLFVRTMMGARVSFSGGKPKVTAGPFAEATEVVGGYWMIEVDSKDEAVAWASRCPASDNEVIEVRQVQELSDFPADVQKAAAGFTELQKRT